ncbi:MAG: ATP-dependent RecD-like DNA helicase [Elusimicrobia bacterium]|nr:ATP-dependent RecD-like DNA helicase [Elusimicrobiota bacterium]
MMNLFPDQQEAEDLVRKHRFSIVTGGAGTGKSTVVRAIVDAHARPGYRISLAAPSGKAAKRLSEVTGREAMTIHRMLGPTKVKGRFEFSKNENNLLAADLVVVDETSMVDISLMASLMKAVSPHTKVVLVGDHYQLPPVGPGSPFRDLLNSQSVPSKELTIIKRQKDGLIVQNAHRIKNGEDIITENNNAGDFYFIGRDREEHVLAKIIEFFSSELLKNRKLDPLRDVQVISPIREKTTLSCKSINLELQKALNPSDPIPNYPFKVGDKVINTKNDYDHNIVNGDMGFVAGINKAEKIIAVNFESPERRVQLPLKGNDLELAYAITVHKAQGSEWPIVIVPVHKSFGGLLLQRNLLYTAVTRAKQLLILVGQRDEIPRVVWRNQQGKRFTNLTQLINGKKS